MEKQRLLIFLIVVSGTLFGWSWAYALRDSPTLRLLCFVALGMAVLAAWRLQR